MQTTICNLYGYYLLIIGGVAANYAKSARDFVRGNVEVNRQWPRPPVCTTVSQTPTPKLSVSKINHPRSGFSSDLYPFVPSSTTARPLLEGRPTLLGFLIT